MLTIDEPPDIRACSECMSPLTWIYVHHLSRNVAVIPAQGLDRFTFRIHTCQLKPEKDWRHVQRVAPETTRRGVRKAREAIARAKERTEERHRG